MRLKNQQTPDRVHVVLDSMMDFPEKDRFFLKLPYDDFLIARFFGDILKGGDHARKIPRPVEQRTRVYRKQDAPPVCPGNAMPYIIHRPHCPLDDAERLLFIRKRVSIYAGGLP